jgi:hypothetical protein
VLIGDFAQWVVQRDARVQELLDLRLCDARYNPPYQVRLTGKVAKSKFALYGRRLLSCCWD